MKKINALALFIVTCLTLSHGTTECVFGNNNNALTYGAIGGLAGGRKGAIAGLAVGSFADMANNAQQSDYQRRMDYERRQEQQRRFEENNYYKNQYYRNLDARQQDLDARERQLAERERRFGINQE